MGRKLGELTRGMRALLHEMAADERSIFIQKHKRKWMEVSYFVNSFPIRNLRVSMVTTLLELGMIRVHPRGHFVLTTRGQLEASVTEIRKHT